MSRKSVPVAQYQGSTLVAKYPSIGEAALLTSVQRAHIGKVAAGLRKSAGGFQWKTMKNFTGRLSPRLAGIAQMDKAGNVLAVYRSAVAASTITGVTEAKISKVLAGNGRIAGGFLWSVVE